MEQKEDSHFYAYMVRCADDTLYSGYTTDLNRRVAAHNSGNGAKYTRSRRPVELVWAEQYFTKHEAMQREAALKKLKRVDKLRLLEQTNTYGANQINLGGGNTMELLDIVDENGLPTGETVERELAHRNGIRHRTSHVWILRKRNNTIQVLLQKRSKNKDSYPGCYDISSAGHIPCGEDYLDSALRELQEELGINATAEELQYCGCRHIEFHGNFHGQSFWDNQVSNIYVLWRDWDESQFQLQESEVESVLWMDWDACLDMVKNNSAPHCIRVCELEMVFSFAGLL